ncbi:MAG: hypothetical protein AAF725_25240, partial [Acidobacteriota bacterium]
MSIDRWCRAIAELPKGRVLLRNLLYDIDRRRLPADLAGELLQDLARRLGDPAGGDPADLEAERAVSWVERFRSQRGARCVCTGLDRPAEPEPCSRVLDEQSCLMFNFRADVLGMPNDGSPPPWLFQELSSRPLEESEVRGEMTTARGFTWVTRSAELRELTASHRPAERADAVCRGLGLSHLRPGARLLAIHYPEPLPWSHRHGPPTALEGGASAAFRSCQRDDGWGRAVDLESLGDGLSELTHEPVPFDASFRIEPLGEVRRPAAPS